MVNVSSAFELKLYFDKEILSLLTINLNPYENFVGMWKSTRVAIDF